MEQGKCEEGTQNVLDLKDKRMPLDVDKSIASSFIHVESLGCIENQDLVNSFASSTPIKTIQSLRTERKGLASPLRAVKQLSESFQNEDVTVEDVDVELPSGISKDNILNLPDKYKTLVEFLDRIDTSMKLLALHKKLPTFQNICTLVEVLTKRKFSYNNLAQIKYMLPEAIKFEKIIIHDDKTLYMTPEMKIIIQFDMIEARPHQSAYMSLRQVFCARLLQFFDSHGEECDIPEAMLPEPFNQRNHNAFSMSLPVESSTKSHEWYIDIQGCNPNMSEIWHHSPQIELSGLDTVTSLKDLGNMESHTFENEELLVSSSLSQSIQRHFSQKLNVPEKEKTQFSASPGPFLPAHSGADGNQNTITPRQKGLALASEPTSMRSPVELIFGPQCSNSDGCESSPVKLAHVLEKLMIETPAQQTPPKRSFNCLSEKISTGTASMSHAAAKRSLSFSPLKDDTCALSDIANDSKQCDDQRLQNAKKILAKDSVTSVPGVSQMVAEDQETNQSSLQKHQQMLAALNDLFSLANSIFQSENRSLITKQELLHKIIANNLDIVDEREVEEQLELLEELIPDWICRKTISSGDIYYSIRKVSDMESIRARLAESVSSLSG